MCRHLQLRRDFTSYADTLPEQTTDPDHLLLMRERHEERLMRLRTIKHHMIWPRRKNRVLRRKARNRMVATIDNFLWPFRKIAQIRRLVSCAESHSEAMELSYDVLMANADPFKPMECTKHAYEEIRRKRSQSEANRAAWVCALLYSTLKRLGPDSPSEV